MEKEIIIKPSFDVKSSYKGIFYIIKSRPKYIIYVVSLMVIIFINIYNSNGSKSIFGWLPFFLIPFFCAVFFYLNFKKTKKQINENPRLKEDIFYVFNSEYLQEKGESFEVKHFWKNLFQIVEKKDMFLFYTNKSRAIILQKIDLKDNQYNELKELFNSLTIKKSLK